MKTYCPICQKFHESLTACPNYAEVLNRKMKMTIKDKLIKDIAKVLRKDEGYLCPLATGDELADTLLNNYKIEAKEQK